MEVLFSLIPGDVLPSTCCQAFFLLSAALILAVGILPEGARKSLMDYGARSPATTNGSSTASSSGSARGPDDRGGLQKLIDALTSVAQVPHSWFLHFYVLSVASSLFWGWQYLQRGSIMGYLAQRQARGGGGSVDQGQVVAVWALMAAQGSRRLYESLVVTRPGRSPMWAVHWVLGLLFYVAIGFAVWIEGSSAILETWETDQQALLLTISEWRPTAVVAAVVFFVFWVKQYQCHRYLAGLVKYTLPDEGMFKYIICPHYTCECGIYLALAHLAAPADGYFNRTVLCGWVFVLVNLGATAGGTKTWYAQKFGEDKVASKWKMIPLLY